ARELDMKQAIDIGVEGVARCPSHHQRAGRRGEAAAECFAGCDLLDIGLAVERILDRAIAGAAADVALQRCAEILALRLVQRRAGQDHAGRAEAALEALRVEERLLHRMHFAIGAKALDGRHRMPFGAKRRNETAVHRLAIEQHGAGAAIAGVAALLHAEMAEFAQEGAQALARARCLRKRLAVDLKTHGRAPALEISDRISSASRSVICLRQNGLPWMSSW